MLFKLSKIGYISKAFGFKGDLRCTLHVESISDEKPEFIFVYLEGKPVPFFVEKFELLKGNFIIKFEDISTEEEAMSFKNSSIYIEDNLFETFFQKEESLDDLIGFTVSDKTKGNIGVVDSIIENSIQPTLVCLLNDKEILIPYTEDIIIKIDDANNKIEIDAPEGLIDMYLE